MMALHGRQLAPVALSIRSRRHAHPGVGAKHRAQHRRAVPLACAATPPRAPPASSLVADVVAGLSVAFVTVPQVRALSFLAMLWARGRPLSRPGAQDTDAVPCRLRNWLRHVVARVCGPCRRQRDTGCADFPCGTCWWALTQFDCPFHNQASTQTPWCLSLPQHCRRHVTCRLELSL